MNRGAIPGPAPNERAIRLAGILAELGIPRLTLTRPDGTRDQLETRRTDLPGAILSAPPGSVLHCAAPRIRVTIHAAALQWESDADAFIRAIHPPPNPQTPPHPADPPAP